jgi:predicted acetyltransferase
MALEIRPYREEETAAFYRVPAIVFGNYTGEPFDPSHGVPLLPDWSLCAFEDGELATAYGAFPLVVRLNGAKAHAAGVTFVGTLPQFRRRGHLRKIMETDFKRRYEQQWQPIAILLASVAAIYQRYGYAVCASAVRYTIDPKLINFAPSMPKPTGTWREGSKDELPVLQRVYDEYIEPRNGPLRRAPVMWEGQTLGIGGAPGEPQPWGPSIVSIYEEGGEPKGYVAWGARWHAGMFSDSGGPGQRVMVRDYAWLTPGAYRAIWELLKTFDLAARVIVDNAPVDDPAPHVLLDPRELNATHRDHILGRIIDLERALPLRPYGHEGRVVFDVRDEMCPWNAGRWALEAGPEGARVTRTQEAPQLSLDISALAQLLYGQVSPANAVRYGRAEAAPDAPLRLWDAMWRTEYAPYCPNMF